MEPVFHFLVVISKKAKEVLARGWGGAVSVKSIKCERVNNSACVRTPSEAAPIATKGAAHNTVLLKLLFQAVCTCRQT